MLIQGEGELESTSLSSVWPGAWGMVACADFRAWYGFHLLSRNLQNLVWNVSAHLQKALEEEGESCSLASCMCLVLPLWGSGARPKMSSPGPCRSSGSLFTFGQPFQHFHLLVFLGSRHWSWEFCGCPSPCQCGRGHIAC